MDLIKAATVEGGSADDGVVTAADESVTADLCSKQFDNSLTLYLCNKVYFLSLLGMT